MFQRMHPSIEEYSSFLDDMDDIIVHKTDNWERMKPYQPKADKTVGITTAVPDIDNDDAFKFYDVNGESLFTNPPDPNFPTVDHGVGEEKIWAFRKTAYNQIVMPNIALSEGFARSKEYTNIPFWGSKLMTPHFFKQEKMDKLFRHWDIREKLEVLKVHQAIELNLTHNQDQAPIIAKHKQQIQDFLDNAYKSEEMEQLKDVYVTDHKKQPTKVSTICEADDELLYNYHKQLKEYNQTNKDSKPRSKKRQYEKGSLAQRVFAPLQDTNVNKDGTVEYEIEAKEIQTDFKNEEGLRRQWEALKNSPSEALEFGEDEVSEMRIAVLESLNEDDSLIDKWQDVLDKEFGVFKPGEKYSYVEDLRRGYQKSLHTSQRDRILATIPDHVFWDIKKPIGFDE